MCREWKKIEFPKEYYIWVWEQQDQEVDQEIDDKMRWERMDKCLVEKGGRKKYITESNGRNSWEWQGSSHSAHAKGMNELRNILIKKLVVTQLLSLGINQKFKWIHCLYIILVLFSVWQMWSFQIWCGELVAQLKLSELLPSPAFMQLSNTPQIPYHHLLSPTHWQQSWSLWYLCCWHL